MLERTTKTIDTLVDDIYRLFDQPHEFDPANVQEFGQKLAQHISNRISDERGKPTLRLSNLGTPCGRKLWYTVNAPEKAEPLPPQVRIKFLFGDILEELLLFLAKEAGHRVEGQQDAIDLFGIKGHRDAVIDGRVVDVKSASSRSYIKFREHLQLDDDAFGYLSQLRSYLAGSRDDGLVHDKDVASFLVIDKQLGHITLDTHAFPSLEGLEGEVEAKKALVDLPEPPVRGYDDVPEGKSGNRALGTTCSYCPFKKECWPEMRTFLYASGPKYLTHVELTPKVPEVGGDTF